MWIFTQDSFLTVSQDRNRRDQFMVRARVAGDIEKYFPEAEVIRTHDADFLFRAFIEKDRVVEVLSRAIGNIDYMSFKGGIKNPARKWFYERIWSVTCGMQDAPG
jgi:hypothetical protein